MGPRLHDAAFHGRKDKCGELFGIDGARQPAAGGIQAGADVAYPAGEVYRQQLAHRRIGLVKLESQRADRTAVGAAAIFERAPVDGEQRKYLGNWIKNPVPGRRQQHRLDAVAVSLEHREQQILFGWEEVIEAAGVGVRFLQQIDNRR